MTAKDLDMRLLTAEEYEEIMKQWDYWRKEIARGFTGSYPRDWFESILWLLEEKHFERMSEVVEINLPVKSRFRTIVELKTDVDDWSGWIGKKS